MKANIIIKGQIMSVSAIRNKLTDYDNIREGHPRHYGDKVIILEYESIEKAVNDMREAYGMFDEEDKAELYNDILSYDAARAEIEEYED